VHRLDKYTSGLLIVAKNIVSAGILYFQILNHEIKREYLAVVEGKTPLKGFVEAPIARVGTSVKREVSPTGLYAKTWYQRIKYQKGYSLLSLRLETGRTHQIRVHLNYLGFPLCGDDLYGGNREIIKRQALHSSNLEFAHPLSKKPLAFSAPLPADMAAIFD
jgi:23S rRNA pseudouridine1911/1915/1917 synthase